MLCSPNMAASKYATHPAFAHVNAILSNLQKNTGRSLQQWCALLKKSSAKTTKDRLAWLKREHGLGMATAGAIVAHYEGELIEYTPDAFVEAMFAGPKAALRPIYERLLKLGTSLGPDVTATPCRTFVPLRRKYAFAQIKPSTRTRIDLGLALGDTVPKGRLTSTGGYARGDRITHQIAIASLDDIDDEVKRWLRAAFERGNETS